MFNKALHVVITLLAAIGGLMTADKVVPYVAPLISAELLSKGVFVFGITLTTIISFLGGGLIGGIVGFFAAPYLIRRVDRITYWLELRMSRMYIADVIAGAIGLAFGLIISNLLSSAFLPIPIVGQYIPILMSMILGFLGLNVGIRKREELMNLLVNAFPRFSKEKKKESEKTVRVCNDKLLDTSVIIDGRIADICKSGFIEGRLIVPVFVLEELQHIADSSDLLKRNRGRRGLDILNMMQKDQSLAVHIEEKDFDDISEVDSKLIKLGQELGAKVVTNDYNLNKVAELQGVTVLNINELSNAVKPVVLPGEEMTVTVVKEGKESGQGVGYLDDGTMIVVEGGRRHVGETVETMVTSVLQTAAGRMIFVKRKE